MYRVVQSHTETNKIIKCNTESCPRWSSWSPWSICEEECGNSTSVRQRHCVGAPFGDPGCPGLAEKSRPCVSQCTADKICSGTSCECWEEAGWITSGSAENLTDSRENECMRILPCMECHQVAICNVRDGTCDCPNGYEGDGYRLRVKIGIFLNLFFDGKLAQNKNA